ncbi:MerR family DNA-binding transcriptional regulator [Micromonospora tulbaghiae]|uniref:MerR family DNA-binding transcriptional regulator n=1 Tax=Micromonospora tulbaghiae TaxID=479978 RepID=A0A386WTB0_9ACTN|nr:helix-turn-helix domain-containing protein [Micromonospora tulbaghiae]AYF30640.1 MerR family DNA-binding transcriptional regulator [Micromonospora tulbaghiae]
MEQLPDLMTVAEVAEVLRLSDETIHRWARIGKLPYIDVLGVKRFRRDVIEALIGGQPQTVTRATA